MEGPGKSLEDSQLREKFVTPKGDVVSAFQPEIQSQLLLQMIEIPWGAELTEHRLSRAMQQVHLIVRRCNTIICILEFLLALPIDLQPKSRRRSPQADINLEILSRFS